MPVFIKKRNRYWFFGGRIVKTYDKELSIHPKLLTTDLKLHVVKTRRNYVVGLELRQKTPIGIRPVFVTLTRDESVSLARALQDANDFADQQ